MIDFKNWYSQITGYCELVSDRATIKSVWVDGNKEITSVTDFAELYEQIFDDLDSESFLRILESYLTTNSEAIISLINFLNALRVMSLAQDEDKRLLIASNLINSVQWSFVVESANKVIQFQGAPIHLDLMESSVE